MLARLRSLLLKTPVKIALGLVAAYFLFAWFGFEPLLKWAAPKYIADKSGHTLSLAAAKFDPLRLSVDLRGLKLVEPDGKPLLAFERLFVDFDAASLFNRAWTFDEIRLSSPDARVELRADGSLNWSALIEALKSEDEEEDKPLPRLLVRAISVEKGRIAFSDRKVDFNTTLNPLDLTLTNLSTLPDDKGAYTLAATTKMGARLRWKGGLTLQPLTANGEIGIDQWALARAWPYLDAKLNMAPPAGSVALALNYRLAYADKKLSLLLDRIGLDLDGLVLRGNDADHDTLVLDKLTLSGGAFDLEKRQVDLGKIALSGGKLALRRDRAGRLDLLDWLPPTAPASAPAPEGTAPGWRVNLAKFSLNGLGIQFNDAGFATPLDAEIGNLQLGFSADAEVGGTSTRAILEGLGVSLSGIRLVSGKHPLFVLGGINLEGGQVDLAKREARAGKLSLANGKLDLVRDARGNFALLEAFKPAHAGEAPHPRPLSRPRERGVDPASTPGWRYTLDQFGLSGFQVGLRDESVRPAGGLTLQGIEATASGLSDNLKAAVPVKLGFRVKEGGRFQVAGKLIPERLRADLKLRLDGLALAPAQPWLSQAANLTLASGHASTQGRVRFDGKARGAGRFDFKGGFAVDDLLLKESETGERFLAWKRLGSETVGATPAGLDIDELKLDALGAKLVIYPDKTVNLKKVLRAAEGGKEAVDAGNAKASSPEATRPEPAFRLNIDRVRVEHGEVDFTDLSLALPFGTRIHDFKGAVNGISSQPGAAAELELDGRVDEYGLARVVGQIDLFDPTGFMDIKTVFRNVEMANLTPYTATFVGRRIESGKLSLDLEYKIKKRQLLGENQIIMDRLTLGERIQSSTAKDLPLDLAIAILQDSDGRIDLGLPVSGSLDDPQFSYGRIIWKAIGNILTKIVTAPFRALAGLFGGNGEKLEQIGFEAGEAKLTPPEKEKFKQISKILSKRPGLALTVHGAWSAEIDRPVMKERQLRRAVVEKMGVKLAPDEDAGPISTAHPKAQTALEALYAARFGKDDWQTLQARWYQANPEKKREGGVGKMLSHLNGLLRPEAPLSEADLGALKGADLHAMLYARLLDQEAVGDATLQALAERRARAIVGGLVQAGAPSERVHAAAIVAFQGEGKEVPAKLELGVAAKP